MVRLSNNLEEFFAGLSWEELEPRIRAAIQDPHAEIPTRIQCPAVQALFSKVYGGIKEDALTAPGAPVSPEVQRQADQYVALLRLLEVLVSMSEDYVDGKLRMPTPSCRSPGPSSSLISTVRPGTTGPTDLLGHSGPPPPP